MRCKKGDLAFVLRTVTGNYVGHIVDVAEYIGYMNEGDVFEVNGIMCKAMITDNYWWIDATSPRGFETPYGPTSRAYSPDTWLKPIPPDLLSKDTETGEEIYNTKPETVEV
jgi:hypothetical protein